MQFMPRVVRFDNKRDEGAFTDTTLPSTQIRWLDLKAPQEIETDCRGGDGRLSKRWHEFIVPGAQSFFG